MRIKVKSWTREGIIYTESTWEFPFPSGSPEVVAAKVVRRQLDTMEESVKDRLIELGWTPPERTTDYETLERIRQQEKLLQERVAFLSLALNKLYGYQQTHYVEEETE